MTNIMTGKKNIILILTDQQALSTMKAFYNNSVCLTPNLNKLAEKGIKFENNYTTCPLCSPARGSIMTGLFPHNHGITSNVHTLGCGVNEIPDTPEMLSRKLQEAGYSCGYTGKWHLGTDRDKMYCGENDPSLPKDLGFEGQNFPGHGAGGFGYPDYKNYLKNKGLEHKVSPPETEVKPIGNCGILDEPIEATIPYFLTDKAISLIDKFNKENSPFFIWHNFWGPHEPYYTTREYFNKYKDIEIPVWPNYKWDSLSFNGPHLVKTRRDKNKLDWSRWAATLKHYYGFMTMIDAQIGRLIDYLEEKEIREDTVIIFTADHGSTIGTHGGMVDKGYSHFEEIQHTPLIIDFPDNKKKGITRTSFTSLVDIYPTILEIAGVNTDSKDGRSLIPLIKGETNDWREEVTVEFHGLNNGTMSLRTIRKGNFKYGFTLGMEDELYNLDNDPYEQNNLINDSNYDKIQKELKNCLLEWMNETNDQIINLFRSTTNFD
ncbi:MAG: sulfatase-like hydrolase/transferase [Halanaerobiales bacterium]